MSELRPSTPPARGIPPSLCLEMHSLSILVGSEQEQLMFIRLKIIPPLADHPSLRDLMGLSFRAKCGNKLDLEMHSLSILA